MPHIKHRFKFLKAVANPSEFTNIKWFPERKEGEEVITNKTILVFFELAIENIYGPIFLILYIIWLNDSSLSCFVSLLSKYEIAEK